MMVRFGNYSLPHVLRVDLTKTRIEVDLPIPSASIGYRVDQTTKGRTLRISGEIRENGMTDVALKIELLRYLADDVARSLDLEDGETAAFNAKLVDPEYKLQVGDWFNTGRCYVPYSVSLFEVA